MNTVLALLKDKQVENDALRNQLNERTADKQSAGSTFSLNLFS